MTLFAGNYHVKYTGTIHLRSLYVLIHDWLIDMEYLDMSGPDFPENLYSLSKSQPGGEEMWIWWRPVYAPQSNPFYRYVLRITFHSFRMNESEAVRGHRKIKVHKGEHKVIITAMLETDYKNAWQKSGFMRYFLDLFKNRIIKNDLNKQKAHLLGHVADLQKKIKEFYGSAHWEDTSRPFMPKLGMKEEEPVGP
ncbi:MAG: hypothetical protein ABIC95_04970 [archaeon]